MASQIQLPRGLVEHLSRHRKGLAAEAANVLLPGLDPDVSPFFPVVAEPLLDGSRNLSLCSAAKVAATSLKWSPRVYA